MRKYCLALIAALATPVSVAYADEGEVVWVDPSCNHFIAKIGDEFGTYNWRSGTAPHLGDRIQGDLLTLDSSARAVQNATAGGENSVHLLALGPKLYSMIHSAPVQCKERFRGSAR